MTFWNARRRRLAAWSAPVWLLVVALAVFLLVRVGDNAAGRAAYAAGDPGNARDRFERTHRVNVVEPWVAAYNRGTASFQLGRLPEARADFTEALRTVPTERDCLVRLNLVATIEAIGDQLATAGRHGEAARAYADGLAVLQQGRCGDPHRPTPTPSRTRKPSPSASPSAQPSKPSDDPEQRKQEEQRRADDQRDRMADKQEEQERAAENEQGRPSPPASPPPAPDRPGSEQGRSDELEQRNRAGRKDQQEAQDRAERGGPRVDRPW